MRYTVALIIGAWSRKELVEQGCEKLSKMLCGSVSPFEVHVEYLEGIDRPEMRISIDVTDRWPWAPEPRKLG